MPFVVVEVYYKHGDHLIRKYADESALFAGMIKNIEYCDSQKQYTGYEKLLAYIESKDLINACKGMLEWGEWAIQNESGYGWVYVNKDATLNLTHSGEPW